MTFGTMDKERGENGKLKGENGKVKGTPQSLCDSSPINKGAKRGEEAGNKKLGHAEHIRVFVFNERRKAPTV